MIIDDAMRASLIKMLADRAENEGAEPYTECDILKTANAVCNWLANYEGDQS